jgi:site-specific recombinase XerD
MRRAITPALSEAGQMALATYADDLRRQRDLRPATHRNYQSDLRQFAAWCEQTWQEADAATTFTPAHLTTPTLTAYRAHLQSLGLSPATINRHLVSLRRYSAWAHEQQFIVADPGKPVKLARRAPNHPVSSATGRCRSTALPVTSYGPTWLPCRTTSPGLVPAR